MTIALASYILATGSLGTPSLDIEGAFTVSEGGTAMARGHVELVDGQIKGAFTARFSRGTMEEFRITRATFFQAVPQLAFLEGSGWAKIRRFGRIELIRGKVFMYVDDLGFQNPAMPDQMFLKFDAPSGEVFVRHGRVTLGDIAVVPE